jgi:hypothetical protein
MVLRHILAVLCEVFSITCIMTEGWIEQDPLHGRGYLKTLCMAAPIDNEEALHHRIVDAC